MKKQNSYKNDFAKKLDVLAGRMKELLPRYSELKQKKKLTAEENRELTNIGSVLKTLEIRAHGLQQMLSDKTFGNVTALYYTLKESISKLGPEWGPMREELQNGYRSVLRERSHESLN